MAWREETGRQVNRIGRWYGVKNKKWKIAGILLGCLLLIIAVILGSIKLYRVKKARESGILLAFDDYNPENWSRYFDFFEQQGVSVTFFVSLEAPTDFCFEAMERGHDIGFHTVSHKNVLELSEEEVQQQVIDPIERFRQSGIELSSFAYPYGGHNDATDEKLLAYYKVIRGAYFYEVHSKADLRKGYVDAFPIDNHYLADDDEFRKQMDAILKELSENVGAVSCLYTHGIGGEEWGITEEHLQYLIERAKELGLQFYTFRELQEE